MSTERFGRLTDPPASFTVVGARVVDPSAGTDTVRDVAVVDGLIAPSAAAGTELVDGRGWVLAPGFCDLHAHFRQPGTNAAETVESGARAAARGGFTTVCAMPNTEPPIDTPEAVATALVGAAGTSCRVHVIGAATLARAGQDAVDVAAMAAAGASGFSDDGTCVGVTAVREVLVQLAQTDRPLIEHPEDPELANGGVARAGPMATRLGLRPWPPEAEAEIVRRDIALAAETGTRLHLTHLSTVGSVESVREARARGVRVTCDVTPHHLALTDAWVGGSRSFSWDEAGDGAPTEEAYDGACRVNPPLASREDALALLAAVDDGTIDAISTDHAPHPPEAKLVPFDQAAPGLIGLETALSLGLAAVDAGRLRLGSLIAALSSRPAAIIGEPRGLEVGAPANLVLFDPAARWRVERESMASASSNTPLLGMELPGVVRLTVADGRVTYRSDGLTRA